MHSAGSQLHDLLITNTLRRHKRQRRLARILTAYSGFGALMALAGLTLLLVDVIAESERILEASIVVFGMALMLTSIAGRNLPALRPADRSRESSDLATITFLSSWRKFEAAAADALESKRAEFSPHSIVSVFSSLGDTGLIGPEDLEELRLLLKLRNALVHGGPAPVPQVALDGLANLTHRLRTLAGPERDPRPANAGVD